MAIRASAACRLRTCLCARPERARMKTSYSGQSSLMARCLGSVGCGVGGGARLGAAPAMLGGVRRSGLADPGAGLMRRAPRLQPLLIAGPVALQHRLELAPVDRTGEVVLAGLIPAQSRVGHGESEELRLRDGDVDELLPQLVVGEPFDAPAHRLRRVCGAGIARTEHHERGPPPAVERILRHGALLRGAAGE